MNKSIKTIFLITLTLGLSLFTFAESDGKKVAMVRLKRGSAQAKLHGDATELKKGEWLLEGSTIKTGPKSFVKLSFIDKSSMNIGPNSEIIIEKFGNKEAGVINVLSGKIRSQVTKNYLEMDKDKSKLFVKSQSAVMGIRGTDFMFTTSKATGATTAVLFEGSVVFNKLNEGESTRDLESIVNRGRRIKPGQFSVVSRTMRRATVPSKMSSKQFFRLEKNKNFAADTSGESTTKASGKSVVPPGLSGSTVKSESIKLPNEITQKQDAVNLETTKGFNRGDDIKPADGSLVHIESGTVIPMGAESSFDSNTSEWSSSTNGSVAMDGEYLPPARHEITDQGDLFRIDPATGVPTKVDTDILPVDSSPKFDSLPVKPVNDGEPLPGNPELPDGPDQLPPPPTPEDCSTCNQPGSVYSPSGTAPVPVRIKGRTKVNGVFQ